MFENEIQEWSETDAYRGVRIMWKVFISVLIVIPICLIILMFPA